ncbi:hypothetical protein BDW22DRAFT_330198 [Trametopsis cervina]|nr:hypothetical protein BDW22DRAFT_330198 [Trametopsis cervina]
MLLGWPQTAVLFLSLLRVLVLGQLKGSPALWTSFVPISVRSPYLNAWMNTTNIPLNNTDPSDPTLVRAPATWPMHYSNALFGWAGLIRIDNETFKFLGDSLVPAGLNRAVLTNIQLTPTRTIMNMTAGPIDLILTFLSPIEPSDHVRQSLPLSYMSLQARSNDGKNHTVQVYSDITGEWSSGDRDQSVSWDVIATDQVIIHRQELVNPVPLGEINGQASDGATFFGIQRGTNVTYMVGGDDNCRTLFVSLGSLTNTAVMSPGIIDKPFWSFALAQDLGVVSGSFTDPIVWSIGILRDPVVAYITPSGTVEMREPYWKSVYGTSEDAASAFLTDFPSAFNRAVVLDTALLQNASRISPHYADLISLAARQAMAGTELTISPSSETDVKMFMRDTGSLPQARVSPVELLYASFPAYLYMNVTYGRYLLEPLLEFSSSRFWTFPYAPADLGLNYPNATGNSLPHNEEVEQTGNMMIMTLAYAQANGDGAILSKYYQLLKGWSDYLVANTLPVPANQLTADQISKPNSTNLAIKGIIGIQAMAKISDALSMQSDAEFYSKTAAAYADAWSSLALSTDPSSPIHLLSNYGSGNSSWTLPYNLFADKWLKTNLIPDSVYRNEAAFLANLSGSVVNKNGVSIDSDSAAATPPVGNTVWTLFTAASLDSADSSVRDGLISPIWSRASQNLSGNIFPVKFPLSSGGNVTDKAASPGVGGVFAPLALTIPTVSITYVSPTTTPAIPVSKSRRNTGTIVGVVIAGVVGLVLALFFIRSCWRRSGTEQDDTTRSSAEQLPDQDPPNPPSSSDGPEQNAAAVRITHVGLRAELESLRRTMQSLQNEQFDTPPPYEV